MAEMIQGEGALYHMECAREHFGADAVDALESGEDVTVDDERLMYVEGDEDSESHDNPFKDETGRPRFCDDCLGYLVEDTMPAPSPVARDIMNLTVEARSFEATRMASTLADIANRWDCNPAEMIARMRAAKMEYSRDVEANRKIKAQALKIARAWERMYNAREVIALHADDDGVLRDADGCAWYEYNMGGYLDRYGDGDMSCTGCGRQLDQHVYYDEFSNDERCPDCVTID